MRVTQEQKIRPFLWFDDRAEQAAEFYTSIFPDSKIVDVSRYGPDQPGPEGKAMVAIFDLCGQRFMALNFFESRSEGLGPAFYVECDDQSEVDRFWERLSEGGQKGQCGWLTDRFGIQWNVVPAAFGEMMTCGDDEQRGRVMQAMLQMKKLDIAGLQRAFDGS